MSTPETLTEEIERHDRQHAIDCEADCACATMRLLRAARAELLRQQAVAAVVKKCQCSHCRWIMERAALTPTEDR